MVTVRITVKVRVRVRVQVRVRVRVTMRMKVTGRGQQGEFAQHTFEKCSCTAGGCLPLDSVSTRSTCEMK